MNSSSSRRLSATNPYARRIVGKREWKVTIYELLESQRAVIGLLRAIGNRHPNDVETQRALTQAVLELAEQGIKLNELLGYSEPKESKE